MTENPNHPDIDVLITRVVDGRAAEADWTGLEAAADRDGSVWRDLAMAQRDQRLLSAAVASEVDIALRVDVPAQSASVTNLRARNRRVASWGGWAAAAVMAVAYLGPRNSAPPGNNAGLLNIDAIKNSMSPEEARDLYLKAGQARGDVIGELPTKVLVETSQDPDGRGVRVVFLRQIMEQATVDDLWRLTHDEMGNRTPMPLKFAPASRKRTEAQ